ncbi:PREDICTED: ubiquitin carboxyl-terminal hydrolase 42 [Gekko japonicus]|uniref:Ubiquitin carboxyl-terminal hydrolase 42 n=1 Tax=Gekko japonicus TaxID=146911 RepID=A0ABM1L6U9_GEKJA|nr:PREDICTED: ubiquitin carboxyl-terminal hydrolase 42 [Gekko japonicus]
MTIVDKTSESSNTSGCQKQPGNSLVPASGEMESGSGGWSTVSSLEAPKRKISLGPVPGAAVYSNSSVPDKSKPSTQKDQSLGDGIAPPQKILFPAEKVCLKWQKTHKVGAGLQNLGNTCFVNSALQCLTYTPPLANYMLSLEHSKNCHEQGFCMMCIMQSHINLALSNSGNTIKPTSVINDLRRIAKHFRFGSQEDAHEFLRYTVDAMQKACLNGSNKLDRYSQATTLIYQIFGGYLRSRVKCMNCKAVSDTFDPYLDIPLEIKTAQSVNKALELFVKPEQLDDENSYKCSKCKKMVPASKRLTIHRASNVLTLSLKRFANFNGGKIGKEVKYSEHFDMRPYMSQSSGDPVIYALYAVMVHAGFSCHAGHYYCYIKASNGQWYQMNDSTVSVSDIRSVLSQQAYMLFYIRSHEVKNGSEHANSAHTPGRSSPRPVINQRVVNNKQTSPGFIGPQLPPHMMKLQNSNHLNGSASLKEAPSSSVASPSTMPLKRPASVPSATSVPNWTLNRSASASATDPSKKQKITISINKLSTHQTASHNSCSAENLNKPVPSSTVSNPSAVQSTSSASAASAANRIPKPPPAGEPSSTPVVNGKSKLSSGILVPYGPESSEDSDEEPKGPVKENGLPKPFNGIPTGSVGNVTESSCASCHSAEEEAPPLLHEPLKSVAVNGAISVDEAPKENGLPPEDVACQAKPGKSVENPFSKANGLHGKGPPAALSPVPEDMILDSFRYTQLKTSPEETSASGTEKTAQEDGCLEALSRVPCDKPSKILTNLLSNIQDLPSPSDPEPISTKDNLCESVAAETQNSHLDSGGQCDPQSKSPGKDAEFCTEGDTEDHSAKMRGPKEGKAAWKKSPVHIRGTPEGAEKLAQSPFRKSDAECQPLKLVALNVVEKSQETPNGMKNAADAPLPEVASAARLDVGTEIQSSKDEDGPRRGNEGLREDAERQEPKSQSLMKEKVGTSKKVDREHYRSKRGRSESEEREAGCSQNDRHYYKKKCCYHREQSKRECSESEEREAGRGQNDGHHYKKRCCFSTERTKRGRSESREREASHSQNYGHHYKKRCCYSREPTKQGYSRREYYNGNKYRFPSSPDPGRSLGKSPWPRSHSREKADLERSQYCPWKGEPSWSRVGYHQEIPRRWEKYRPDSYYYSSHIAKSSQDRKVCHGEKDDNKSSHIYNKPYKDYYKSRWTHDPPVKERERDHVSSSKADMYRCPVPSQRPEKYPLEREAPVPEEHSLHPGAERPKERKRKCPSPEGSDSNPEKKCQRRSSPSEPLEEQKSRKHKKSKKKKKKSKDKHRERDYRHHQDSDPSASGSETEAHKHKKKKKKRKKRAKRSESCNEPLEPHVPKSAHAEGNGTWETTETLSGACQKHGRQAQDGAAAACWKSKCAEGGDRGGCHFSTDHHDAATEAPFHKDHSWTVSRSASNDIPYKE